MFLEIKDSVSKYPDIMDTVPYTVLYSDLLNAARKKVGREYDCYDPKIGLIYKNEVENLKESIIAKGINVFNDEETFNRIENLKAEIEELEHRNKKLQHNVSQLQLKLNKYEKEEQK